MKKHSMRIAVAAFCCAVFITMSAVPAQAASYGGSMNCPSSAKVSSTGFKGGTSSIIVSAPGVSLTNSMPTTGYYVRVIGGYATGPWTVTGNGATSGYGACS